MPTRRSGPMECDDRFPHHARELVERTLRDAGGAHTDAAVVEAMDLLVSELVTYAMVAGEFDRATVQVALDGDDVRVEVTDPDSYLATVVSDLPLEHTLRAGGLGLFMVDRVARRWAVEADGDGTTVWFEARLDEVRRATLVPTGRTG